MNKPVDAVLGVDLGVTWVNSLSVLGPAFSTPLAPTPLPAPYWVGRNRALARELGLGDDWLQAQASLEALSGNLSIAGAAPLASIYSGHQFGVWAGQLGDGRAILLGEALTAQGAQEIQLKGSGRTPYSRMGDGRAVLRSSIREFLCSEAMHGLGIPTSRALCVTGSDAPVYREEAETAAVVTRVAPSFLRFGHFEHFAARNRSPNCACWPTMSSTGSIRNAAQHLAMAMPMLRSFRRSPRARRRWSPSGSLLGSVTES